MNRDRQAVGAVRAKIEGRWLITHEHSSVPFDVGSGKALLDLQP